MTVKLTFTRDEVHALLDAALEQYVSQAHDEHLYSAMSTITEHTKMIDIDEMIKQVDLRRGNI